MNVVVVALQNFETEAQPCVRGAKDREVMKVLDLMVDIQLVQDELQSRHELAGEFQGWKLAGTKLLRDLFDSRRQLAKHCVARQPEARHVAQIGVRFPFLARITREHNTQIFRPAVAVG